MAPRCLSVVAVTALLLLAGAGAATAATATGAGAAPQQQANGACDYTALYEETIDSVVSIRTTAGLGSGFVYQANDIANATNDTANATNVTANATYVVTNAHVVGDASEVQIEFSQGESRMGTVVGQDVYSDLAVVRVEDAPDEVEALPVYDGQPQHGERVAALGNPFGLEQTITHGIVSGVNRSMPTQRGFAIPNTIQTDAPISPGNSGGPLVTCQGEVIGVNTAGIAAQGAENIGFAISASVVERVVPSLIETGEFDHPYLGISATPVSPPVAQANNLNTTHGVMVVSVNDESPAADDLEGATGIANESGEVVPVGGDVIVAIEGQPVESTEDLRTVLLQEVSPGDEIELTVLRDGERVEVTTTVTERPEPTAA